jgi:hypothetical protein
MRGPSRCSLIRCPEILDVGIVTGPRPDRTSSSVYPRSWRYPTAGAPVGGGVDPIDAQPADAGMVLVFGPVAALEQAVGRLIE